MIIGLVVLGSHSLGEVPTYRPQLRSLTCAKGHWGCMSGAVAAFTAIRSMRHH